MKNLNTNTISDEALHQITEQVVRNILEGQNSSSFQGDLPPTKEAPQTTNDVDRTGSKSEVIAIGSDHGGFDLKETLKKDLLEQGYKLIDVGTNSKEACDYPDYAHDVAHLVSTGKAGKGIMIDGAGIGSCMAANKVPGIRAGMAYDVSTAINGREHNNTNVLTLGAGLIGLSLAKQIVKTWLDANYAGGRHEKRVQKIMAIEKQYSK
jgi:ribose 5-phosphate isomerase B